jgi:hypothetical protein
VVEDSESTADASIESFDLDALEVTASSTESFSDAAFREDQNYVVALELFPPMLFHLDPTDLSELGQIELDESAFTFTFDGFGGDTRARYFSPDGRLLVLASLADDGFSAGPCLVFDTADGRILAELDSAFACNVSFSFDSERLYLVDGSGLVSIFDTADFSLVGQIEDDGAVFLAPFEEEVVFSSINFSAQDLTSSGLIGFSSEPDFSLEKISVGSPVTSVITFADYPWILTSNLENPDLLVIDGANREVAGRLTGDFAASNSYSIYLSSVSIGGAYLIGTPSGQVIQLDPNNIDTVVTRDLGIGALNALSASPAGDRLYVFGAQSLVLSTSN